MPETRFGRLAPALVFVAVRLSAVWWLTRLPAIWAGSSPEVVRYAWMGFVAQAVDGALGMAYGVATAPAGTLPPDVSRVSRNYVFNRAIKMAQQAGLEVRATFMLGNPGETPETMQRTIEYAVDLDPDLAQLFRQTFELGHSSPADRPSLDTWELVLSRLRGSVPVDLDAEQFAQVFAGCADKRQTLLILVVTGGFADEHNIGICAPCASSILATSSPARL